MLTVGSLFSGIGGFDLGLERAGMRVIWQSEIDPYASAVLRKHWPHVPNHGDIRSISAGVERPDVVCGGFPCQPFSHAGARAGAEDDRHLWPEMCRVIGELRPAWVLGENVAGIISMELDAVLSDLERIGYATQAFVIPAVAVDAPHRRDRVWIVACDANRNGKPACAINDEVAELCGAVADADGSGCARERGRGQAGAAERRETFANTDGAGSQERQSIGSLPPEADRLQQGGRPEHVATWEPESGIRRVVDGIPNRVHRLRTLGNSIVPQVAEVIGRAIVNA